MNILNFDNLRPSYPILTSKSNFSYHQSYGYNFQWLKKFLRVVSHPLITLYTLRGSLVFKNFQDSTSDSSSFLWSEIENRALKFPFSQVNIFFVVLRITPRNIYANMQRFLDAQNLSKYRNSPEISASVINILITPGENCVENGEKKSSHRKTFEERYKKAIRGSGFLCRFRWYSEGARDLQSTKKWLIPRSLLFLWFTINVQRA